jgi:hypothetical protein
MGVRPDGIISIEQTWYCRISIQKDELQSEFPSQSKFPKPVTQSKEPWAPKRAFAEEVLRNKWPSPVRPTNVMTKTMVALVVDEAKWQGKPKPEYRTITRAIARVWPKRT